MTGRTGRNNSQTLKRQPSKSGMTTLLAEHKHAKTRSLASRKRTSRRLAVRVPRRARAGRGLKGRRVVAGIKARRGASRLSSTIMGTDMTHGLYDYEQCGK